MTALFFVFLVVVLLYYAIALIEVRGDGRTMQRVGLIVTATLLVSSAAIALIARPAGFLVPLAVRQTTLVIPPTLTLLF